jgi:hypothetical protein
MIFRMKNFLFLFHIENPMICQVFFQELSFKFQKCIGFGKFKVEKCIPNFLSSGHGRSSAMTMKIRR